MAPRPTKTKASTENASSPPSPLKPKTEKAKVEKIKSEKSKAEKPLKATKLKVTKSKATSISDTEAGDEDGLVTVGKPKVTARKTDKDVVGAKDSKDGKEKVKAVTGDEAVDVMLKYLKEQNRPYSATEVSANLHGKVTKTVADKLLKEMEQNGLIMAKATNGTNKGSQWVFWTKQVCSALSTWAVADYKTESSRRSFTRRISCHGCISSNNPRKSSCT